MSFIAELKRRNVFRVALAYLALAWLLTEVADILFPASSWKSSFRPACAGGNSAVDHRPGGRRPILPAP